MLTLIDFKFQSSFACSSANSGYKSVLGCRSFFCRYPALLTKFYWISQKSSKFGQLLLHGYEELAGVFEPIRKGEKI